MKAGNRSVAAQRASKPKWSAQSLAPRAPSLLASLALCAITLLVYANSFSAGFSFDNRGLLLLDPRIREATWQNLGLILQHTYWWPYGESGLYRPFTTLSYLFNYAVLDNGSHPAGYHWLNFLLHAGNVLLVYALARQFVRAPWPSFFIAAIWTVHPVLTESVTNIVGRADLLAGMTLLGGLLMYVKSAETQGCRRWAWLAGLMLATTVGVFSKESAVTVLGAIVLYEVAWRRVRKRIRPLLLGCFAVLPALGAMWYGRAAIFRSLPAVDFPFCDNPLVGADFWTAKLTAIKVLARYLGLLVWPTHLSSDYSYAQIPLVTGSLHDWLAWIAVAAVVAAVALMYRLNRTVWFLAGMTFATFLPSSNLLFPIGTIMAERFLYLPAIALAACVVLTLYAIGNRFGMARLAPTVLCLIAAALAVRTWARNSDWHDEVSLMTAAVETSPNSYKSHIMLALALYDSDPTHASIGRVLAEAEKAVAILDPLPNTRISSDAYHSAGGYYLAEGALLQQVAADGKVTIPPEGLQAYRRGLELLLRCRAIVNQSYEQVAAKERARGHIVPVPDAARAAGVERSISEAYLGLHETRKAVDAATVAFQQDPLNAETYRQLSASLLADGRADDSAIALVEGALVTSDQSLRQELLSFYQRRLDPTGCAIVSGPNGPALNSSCETVRKHTCAAVAGTIRLYLRIQRQDLAGQMKASASQVLGCPAELFN